MAEIVHLNAVPADSAVLRRLQHLSSDAMRFVLALHVFRQLTGRSGIVRMSEIMRSQRIASSHAVVNELLDAGIMGERDDGIFVYHPAILAMMMPDCPPPGGSAHDDGNVVSLPNRSRRRRCSSNAA